MGARLTDPAVAAAVDRSIANVGSIPQVALAAGPAQTRLTSPDGRVGLGTLQWKAQPGEVDEPALQAVQEAMQPAEAAGVTVDYSGSVFPGYKVSVPELPEIIGIIAAFVILLVTFGAVVAAGLPIITACIGVGIGALGIFAVAAVVDMPRPPRPVALMLGLSCGIDYGAVHLEQVPEQAALACGRRRRPPAWRSALRAARSCSRRHGDHRAVRRYPSSASPS